MWYFPIGPSHTNPKFKIDQWNSLVITDRCPCPYWDITLQPTHAIYKHVTVTPAVITIYFLSPFGMSFSGAIFGYKFRWITVSLLHPFSYWIPMGCSGNGISVTYLLLCCYYMYGISCEICMTGSYCKARNRERERNCVDGAIFQGLWHEVVTTKWVIMNFTGKTTAARIAL